MSSHAASFSQPEDDSRPTALAHARELVRGRSAPLPAEALAALVVRTTAGGDEPVRTAAFEAIRRRVLAAEREELRVATRPTGGVGTYALRSKERGERPYRTLVADAARLDGSCSCRDAVRNGLGICKHLVVAFADALARSTGRRAVPARLPEARFTWDPVRPLTGVGDPLARITFSGRPRLLGTALRRWFDGWRCTVPPERERAAFVRALLGTLKRRATAGGDDPALVPMLVDEEARLTRLAAGATLVRGLDRHLKGLKRKLFPYQREGVSEALRRGFLLLADDMGLGKTAQAIATGHALLRSGAGRRVLVVAPASLRLQWAKEWASFSDVPVTVVEGSAAGRAALYRRTREGALVAGYESVVRDIERIVAWKPDLVVLDEAQRLKNWQTKTAATVKRLAPPFRLVLTGTPFENRLEELASLMDWVDDHALEPKWRLPAWHLARHSDGSSGARNLDTLRTRLAPGMLRRRKAEVLAQLPARTDTRVPVALSRLQAEEHDELDPRIAKLVQVDRPLTQPEFLRLMQLLTRQRMLCNGLALAHFEELAAGLERKEPTATVLESLSSPKLGEFRELVENLAVTQGRRIVVFSQWRRMLSLAHWAVKDLLEAEGLSAVFFSGSESHAERARNVERFHDDPRVRLFFATDAGGVGLNLQRAADTLVNLELPWNPAVLEQRIGRVWRLGQKNRVEIYHLVCEAGIEARIAGIVSNKKMLFSGLFDGSSDTLAFEAEGSFREKVKALYEGTAPAETGGETAEVIADLPEGEGVSDGPAPASAVAPSPSPVVPTSVPRQPVASAPSPVADLFARVRLERTPEGGVRLEAPPEAAAPLAEMFAAMAKLFAGAGGT